MKRYLAAAILITATLSIVSPAFASGYGPAPFYHPDVGSTFPRHAHWGRSLPANGSDNDAGYASDTDSPTRPSSQSGAQAPLSADPAFVPKQ